MDLILDAGPAHGRSKGRGGMRHDGSQNNEYHVLVDKILAEEFAILKIKPSFFTDVSKNCFIMFTNMRPQSNIAVHLFFTSFPPGSKKQEKCALHPSTCNLAAGPCAVTAEKLSCLVSFNQFKARYFGCLPSL